MNKIIAIILILATILTQSGVKKAERKPTSGIGTAAYHEQECGIGEAAEHTPEGR